MLLLCWRQAGCFLEMEPGVCLAVAGMDLTSHGAKCPNWTQPLVKVDLCHDTFLSSRCHLTLGVLGIAGDTTSAIPAFHQQ